MLSTICWILFRIGLIAWDWRVDQGLVESAQPFHIASPQESIYAYGVHAHSHTRQRLRTRLAQCIAEISMTSTEGSLGITRCILRHRERRRKTRLSPIQGKRKSHPALKHEGEAGGAVTGQSTVERLRRKSSAPRFSAVRYWNLFDRMKPHIWR